MEKLVPHLHNVATTSCQQEGIANDAALFTPTSPTILGLQQAIPLCLNAPIGRIELISAIINTCDSRKSCSICSQITSAARFLSKEMMMFKLNSNEVADKDSIKLVVQKSAKLIRINQKRVHQQESIDITHGSIISILLPHSPVKGSINDKKANSRLSIQFTYITKEEAKLKRAHSKIVSGEKTRRKEECTAMDAEASPESSKQLFEASHDEDSPTLTMPNYLNFEACGQSNSFESSISGGLLTLQESASDLSSQKVNLFAPGNDTGILLSSLTKEQLTNLIDGCEDSDKGKFQKHVLEMVLEDNPLPVLLRSTRIHMKSRER
eukprot:scaffold2250_cov289-Chaetoceros_neogracile.AAC.9